MNFRTVLPLEKSPFSITYQDKILSLGSCFSENIGGLLQAAKFDILINPFGILYHPIAIANNLTKLIDNQLLTTEDLIYRNHQWHNFDFHSRLSQVTQAATLQGMNNAIQEGHHQLQQLNFLLLTFGTAHGFFHQQENRLVANCHKLPNEDFKRKRYRIEAIVEAFRPVLKRLFDQNPTLKVILTVSPVRHIRDGLIENQRSKSTLILAAMELEDIFQGVNYFPAFEIIQDDLRDYRFYAEDMIHPSKQAIDYIWKGFQTMYFSEATHQLYQRILKVTQAFQHRPFDVQSIDYQLFAKNTLSKIYQLEQDFPFLNFKKEKTFFLEKSQ